MLGNSGWCHRETHYFIFYLSQEVKSYPVQWIKVVEKIDDNAFHWKHMFQLVVIPSGHIYSSDTPNQVNLYLQAAVSALVVVLVVPLKLS